MIMRRGRLFRSGQLTHAAPADLKRLAALGIKTVVDLRRSAERADGRVSWPDGVSVETIFRNDGGDALPPHLMAFVEAGGSVEAAREAMLRIYRAIPFDPMIADLTGALIGRLCDGEEAVLVHCAAGKDRTGFVVAFIHILLEIEPEDWREHYLLSHEACLADTHSLKRMQEALGRPGRMAKDEAVRVVLSALPEFLETALQSVRERCGSIERYARETIGISPDMHSALRRTLLR